MCRLQSLFQQHQTRFLAKIIFKNGSMRKGICILALLICSWSLLSGQERVYVSTDKDIYLVGEDIWYSVHCIDDESGSYSNLSDVAYLQFVSNDGVAATSKVALIDGRGAGRFRIPFSFATGNYSIVSFTRSSGGDSNDIAHRQLLYRIVHKM